MNMPPATLNYKIPVESNDEIGYLAASMNYMAGEAEQLRRKPAKIYFQHFA